MNGTRVNQAEAERHPLLWDGDVVVVGGGSAGSAAAVAAARRGSSTLLVESAAHLGGTGASVLDTFYGFYAPGTGERVVGGVGWEVCQELTDRKAAFERPNTYGAGTGITYDPETLKLVWDELTGRAGVRVLFHARASRVVMEGQDVLGVVVETVAGPGFVRAQVVVDASGDADIAWRAGAALERPAEDRVVQPLTQTFRLAGVDAEATSTAELHRLMALHADSGAYELPRREGSVHRTTEPGVVHTNVTRVSGVDPTDPWQLSGAEQEGRRQVVEYTRFLVEQVPGYERAFLIASAPRIGVRESRRLIGEYVLGKEDVLSARQFDDAIARCGAPIEDHAAGQRTIWQYVGSGDQTPTGRTYGVPYRCLLPRGVDGLLVAGRCLSATHDAHASVRSIGQCMAMGQAAGAAAALAVSAGCRPRDANIVELREQLAADGALIAPD
ncbi:FAD-dependent oxidoreductase [Streptomyces yerevanensis]|uniref:FAD-dependent oxidoreductase n=1 Tax=Streptomyces yerevanensis TaxID=66378 RepID=UPI000996E69A|nr:FAD-dependent oxidoreductase [Streptomyces yerevanensis]